MSYVNTKYECGCSTTPTVGHPDRMNSIDTDTVEQFAEALGGGSEVRVAKGGR